jgi:IS30 family transposase
MRRATRASKDLDIVRLNSLGLSLTRIAKELQVHHTTVTYRLRVLNIPPADTRRSFMEDVYDQLSPAQQEWLAHQLGTQHSIKEFVTFLITKEYFQNPTQK